jgi:hypothetical protein
MFNAVLACPVIAPLHLRLKNVTFPGDWRPLSWSHLGNGWLGGPAWLAVALHPAGPAHHWPWRVYQGEKHADVSSHDIVSLRWQGKVPLLYNVTSPRMLTACCNLSVVSHDGVHQATDNTHRLPFTNHTHASRHASFMLQTAVRVSV